MVEKKPEPQNQVSAPPRSPNYPYAYPRDRSWPPKDVWGLSDLWEVTDTQFRRPGEALDEAWGRWILFLMGRAWASFLGFLTLILLCCAGVLIAYAIKG